MGQMNLPASEGKQARSKSCLLLENTFKQKPVAAVVPVYWWADMRHWRLESKWWKLTRDLKRGSRGIQVLKVSFLLC